MLKRRVVSLFHSLKSKGKRYYWEQPKNDIINELHLIKQKYDIPKEIVDHIKKQEKQIKEIKDELTNQKKVVENINSNVKNVYEGIDYIYVMSLINMAIISYIN